LARSDAISRCTFPATGATGHEVDLLIPEAARVHAIEIKAGATVNPDYFKGLQQFAKAHPAQLASGRVVYGGAQSQPRSDWPVSSWQRLRARDAAA
jgi:uncharacterized protein